MNKQVAGSDDLNASDELMDGDEEDAAEAGLVGAAGGVELAGLVEAAEAGAALAEDDATGLGVGVAAGLTTGDEAMEAALGGVGLVEAVEAETALAEEGVGVDMAISGGSVRQQQHVASGEKRKSDSKSKSA